MNINNSWFSEAQIVGITKEEAGVACINNFDAKEM